MHNLPESKELLDAIVPGTPEERVETLIGNKNSAEYHKAAEQVVKLMYAMDMIRPEDQPVDVDAMLAGPVDDKDEVLEKICAAAVCFDELYQLVVPFVAAKIEHGVAVNDPAWPGMLTELRARYAGKRDDEINILFVYYMVTERGVSSEDARALAGLTPARGR